MKFIFWLNRVFVVSSPFAFYARNSFWWDFQDQKNKIKKINVKQVHFFLFIHENVLNFLILFAQKPFFFFPWQYQLFFVLFLFFFCNFILFFSIQASTMAHMQLEVEKQMKKKSPIAEMVNVSNLTAAHFLCKKIDMLQWFFFPPTTLFYLKEFIPSSPKLNFLLFDLFLLCH